MKNTNRTPRFLFAILLILMALPFVFSFVPATRGKALFGVQTQPLEKPTFWRFLDQSWQNRAEEAAKRNMGFANHGVRLLNELNYRCFRYSSAPKLVLGKEDYFYEDIYLNEYTGKDFVGDSIIVENVKKLKKRQEELNQQGIDLLLVLEPGKARFMPEYLPNRCHKGERTNYDRYVKELQRQHIQYLDLNQYFSDIKATAKHPLYSRHGIHWTTYGMWVAADTLQKFIERQCALQLSDIRFVKDSLSDQNKDLDFDLEPPMNLMRELPHETLCFPVMAFEPDTAAKPEVLIVADSYVWSLWSNGILHHWFGQPDFWYYNETVYPDIWAPNAVWVDRSRTAEVASQKRVILLMMTDANLRNFGWQFLDNLSTEP